MLNGEARFMAAESERERVASEAPMLALLAPNQVVHVCGQPVELPVGATIRTTHGNWKLIQEALNDERRRGRDSCGDGGDGRW